MKIRAAIAVVLAGALVAWPRAQTPYRILLTNDDGVQAPGLAAAAAALTALGEVHVIAPTENQSGKGTSLTMVDPIHRIDARLATGMTAIGLMATPVTTVRVAIGKLLTARPDLVVSGINNGVNTGLAAYISGTVAGAREAAALGIPAIAASLASRAAGDVASYAGAAEATVRVAQIVRRDGLPKGVFLGVNVPEGTMATYKGFRVTRQGRGLGVVETFEERLSPRTGKPYYWNRMLEAGATDADDTDTVAVKQGYVTVTPYRVGEFDPAAFESLSRALAR